MKLLVVGALCALALCAQGGPGNIMPARLSPELVQYLQLTPEQVNAVIRLNAELRRFQSEKQMRMAQVQRELAQEMQKQTLDAMGIGLRHVEMEAIRREIRAKATETTLQIQERLTAEQKTRAAALEQVLTQHGLACTAAAFSVIAPSRACGVQPVVMPRFEPTVFEP